VKEGRIYSLLNDAGTNRFDLMDQKLSRLGSSDVTLVICSKIEVAVCESELDNGPDNR